MTEFQIISSNFQSQIDILVSYLKLPGIVFNGREMKVPLLRNPKFLNILLWVLFYLYMATFETINQAVAFETIWCVSMLTQSLHRSVNYAGNVKETEELISWFRSFSKFDEEESQLLTKKSLKTQNESISNILKFLPRLTFWPARIVILYNVLTLKKDLPGPFIFQGQHISEFSWPVFLVLFIAQYLLVYTSAQVIVAADCFFAVTATILTSYLKRVTEIVNVIKNEEGKGGAQVKKLQKVYEMHSEFSR